MTYSPREFSKSLVAVSSVDVAPSKLELRQFSSLLLGAMLVIVLVSIGTILWLRHARHALRDPVRPSNKRARRLNPWREAGKRAPPGFEPGADDDTVDIDPTELGPTDIGPGGSGG